MSKKNGIREVVGRNTKSLISKALEEDIGIKDITTKAVIPEGMVCDAVIFSKEKGVVCGIPIAKEVFKTLDRNIKFKEILKDGDTITSNQKIIEISGKARSILSGERVALNFLQRLSGIATYVRRFVKIADSFGVKILDTRKTTPGLRFLEKYAVRIGGGVNHRFGLWDRILIKKNHINLVGLETAIEAAKKTKRQVEVEVRNLSEVKKVINLGVDVVMLDNMDIKTVNKAIKLIRGKALVEVSGGVSFENIKKIIKTRPDWVSIGRLTYSAGVLDMSLVVRRKKTLFNEQTYILPKNLRDRLKGHLGVTFLGKKEDVLKKFERFIKKKKFQRIITVGDYCSLEIPSDVKIFDGRIKRKKVKKRFPYSFLVQNPAGTIQKKVWEKVELGVRERKNIFVKGEEDLLVIPSVLTAPENSLIIYGLPGEGVCLIENSPRNKAFFRGILEKFIPLP